MFSIPNSNYPGTDGYSSGSFNANLNVAGPTVCAAALELFQTGKLITHLNAVDGLPSKVQHPQTAHSLGLFPIVMKFTMQ